MHISSSEENHPYIIKGHLLIALPNWIAMSEIDDIILADIRQCHMISVSQRDRPFCAQYSTHFTQSPHAHAGRSLYKLGRGCDVSFYSPSKLALTARPRLFG